jgi:hypothetical protein
MARKQGQIIARGQSAWLVRIYHGRDPRRYAQIPEPNHSRTNARGEALLKSQASAERQDRIAARGGHQPQPISRPVAHNRGKAEAPGEDFLRLRDAAPARALHRLWYRRRGWPDRVPAKV